MSDDLVIPIEHWADPGSFQWRDYWPDWERQLRANIKSEPDPSKRFSAWLARLADGGGWTPGVKLLFIEQPYLEWAELTMRLVERREKEVRQQIAAEILAEDQ